MRLTKKAADELVVRGASYLDTALPKWWESVDCKKLELSAFDCCIEGQLFGAKDQETFDRLNRVLGVEDQNLGFTLPYEYHKKDSDADNPNWKVLTAAWVRAIESRQATARLEAS